VIDTIKIGFTYEMSPQELKGWRNKHGEQKNGYVTHEYAYAVITPNECKITCSYMGTSFDGKPLLTIEFSLPKMLRRNNIQTVGNLGSAITQANEIIASLPGLPPIDIRQGEILRLDIAYNHQVGDLGNGYIDYLSKMSYSRRTTHSYLYETAYFSNKSVSSMFYDKFKESQLDGARGILRQEISYTNKKMIQEIFKAKHLGDLAFPNMRKELEKDLEALGLDRPIPSNGRYSWVELVEKHGYYAATFFYGLSRLKGIFPIG